METEQELTVEEYEHLLAQYENSFKNLQEGQIIRGRVLTITPSEVIVDIGYKSEGIIPLSEFTDFSGQVTIKQGDPVDVLLERTEDQNGYVVLSKDKAEKMKVWDEVEKSYRSGSTVRGRVIDRIKGGLAVDIGVKAFLPGSLVDVKPVKNLEALRGKDLDFKVISVDKKRGNIVLSRKAVVEVEQEARKKETLQLLEEGRVLRGTVKNLTDYGAFVDLGGLDGLLHVTDMSWGRVNHPSDLVKVGDEIDVVVLKFDRETERVSLGTKQLTEDPWAHVPEKYPAGSRVTGRITNVTDYGAFVELEDGVEGLVHVSEMSWSKKIKNPSKVVSPGDTVEAVVSDVNPEARRISLSLKDTLPDPWESVAQKYTVGSRVAGKVRNLTDFGAFVELEEGIDGLVHVSDMSWTRRVKHPSEVLKKGDDVEAIITSIDQENRRISLSIKEFQPNDWQTFKEKHQPGDLVEGVVTRIADFGVFVQIEGLVEGLMHVSETPLPRGEKPQDHFKEGDPVRARILRIEDAEMKVGLSGVGVDDAPAAAATADAEAVPVASEAPAAPKRRREAPAAKRRRRKRLRRPSPSRPPRRSARRKRRTRPHTSSRPGWGRGERRGADDEGGTDRARSGGDGRHKEAGRSDRGHRLRGHRPIPQGRPEDRAAGIRILPAAGAGRPDGPQPQDRREGLRSREEDSLLQAGQGAEGTDQPVMPDVLFAPWRYEYLVSDKETHCIFCAAAASENDEESLVVHRGRARVRRAQPVSVHERPRHGGALCPRGLVLGLEPRDPRRADRDGGPGPEDPGRGVPDGRTQRRRQLRLRGRRGRGQPLPRARRSALAGRHELHDRHGGNARRSRGARSDAAPARAALRGSGGVVSSETSLSVRTRSPWLVAVLAWLVPGLGHVMLGRRRTGMAFAAIVTLTFLAGVSFQGRLYSVEPGQPLTILATFAVYGSGILNLVARGLSDNPGGAILSPTYEYGCAYLLTAGLMNLLLVLDAWDIATGKKR